MLRWSFLALCRLDCFDCFYCLVQLSSVPPKEEGSICILAFWIMTSMPLVSVRLMIHWLIHDSLIYSTPMGNLLVSEHIQWQGMVSLSSVRNLLPCFLVRFAILFSPEFEGSLSNDLMEIPPSWPIVGCLSKLYYMRHSMLPSGWCRVGDNPNRIRARRFSVSQSWWRKDAFL